MDLLSQLNARSFAPSPWPSFGGIEASCPDYDSASIVIIPVPYDRTSTYRKGADRGPEAVLRASEQLEFYDIETRSEVHTRGIFTLPPLVTDRAPEDLASELREVTRKIVADGKLPLVLGGDHSVSIGAAQGVIDSYSNLTVLQLDAHADTRETYQGSTHNHACVMARLREHAPITQVGIRSISAQEVPNLASERVFYAHQIHTSGADISWHHALSSQLGPDIYLTVDLDCFDSSLVPATGTPEPGGLFWPQVTALLRSVCSQHRIRGFDIVELLPDTNNPASDFLAAKLAYQILSYIFAAEE